MATILIADDDPHIRELVRYLFEKTGFAVADAADGRDALAVLEGRSVDCAVIDVMMPRMDGWDLCRAIKAAWDIPVLMLTAKRETAQKVKGLTIGADDYLVKPFESEELLARVRALLRRWRREEPARVEVGRVVLERDTREAVLDGERISLPQKEFELLLKLASRPGVTFSRDAIIQDVWGMDFEGTERTVDVHVNRLRDHLPEQRCGFRITALRGIGYRLEAAE
jgi:two-component system, OmpR family, response regulator